jgi:hypothetical protein
MQLYYFVRERVMRLQHRVAVLMLLVLALTVRQPNGVALPLYVSFLSQTSLN